MSPFYNTSINENKHFILIINQGDYMLAYCGINCSECKAYIATQTDNDILRGEAAKEWSKTYEVGINPVDIQCDGCKNENGILFFHCASCDIRSCARKKGFGDCSECDEYPCSKLDIIHSTVSEAKNNLDELIKNKNTL